MQGALATILQQLAQSTAAIVHGLDNQANMAVQQQARHAEKMEALRTAVSGLMSRNTGVVDVRQVGRPDVLKGNRDQAIKDWPAWHGTFTTWFNSQFNNGKAALDWSKDSDRPLTQTLIMEHAEAED